jgi:hypothetical protein
MSTKIDFKKWLPYGVGILTFLIVVLVYFGPLWQGKQVRQGDNKTFLGVSKEVVDYRQANDGKEALWTNSLFGGMPAYQVSVSKKENLLRYIDSYLFRLSLPRPADYVFLYMLGFFILLLVLKVDPWLSIIGALAFGFSSYFFIILEAGHNSKAHAIGYMAPTLAFIIYTFRSKKYLIGGTFFALFMALELYTNHPQIAYYLMFIVLAYGASELWGAIREKQLLHFTKAVGVLFIGLLLAVAVNLNNYWTTYEYSPETIRGKSELTFDKHIKSSGLDKDYATQWSYGIDETWTLMIPNAKGGGSIPISQYAPKALDEANPQYRQNIAQIGTYWGDQPMTSGPVYVGAIIVFLFILGLLIVPGRLKWSLLAVTLISIFLSWGHNWMAFSNLFFDYFPAYNKFRTVSMILVIAELTMVLLAILALDAIIKRPQLLKENARALYISLALTGGLSLVFYLLPDTFFSFLNKMDLEQLASLQKQYPDQAMLYQELFDELANVRMSIFKADSMRSFLFIVLAAGLIFGYGRKQFNKYAFYGVIGLLIFIDLAAVNHRFLNDDSYEKKSKAKIPYAMTDADRQILQDKSLDFRVFNTTVNTFNDASTSYNHKSIGGYHGAKLRRYQDLIEHHLSVGNMEVLNMLNTKYFIVGGQEQAPQAQMNPSALGNAWFVKNINWVNNADHEIIHLGRVIEIKALGDISKLSVYGRPLQSIDTILWTSPIFTIGFDETEKKISLSRLPIKAGITYVVGNDPSNTDSNFIDLSNLENGNLLASKQFEMREIYDFKPAETAVVDKRFKAYLDQHTFEYSPTASIQLSSYAPNELKYTTHADRSQLAVFSEIYYNKGWNAYLDGKKVDYIRANYVLRSLVVPAGDHTLVFKFEPSSYFIGKQITLISSSLLILLVLFTTYWEFFVRRKEN